MDRRKVQDVSEEGENSVRKLKPPLAMDEGEYAKRNSSNDYWKKFKSWRQGFEAAKEGLGREACPYVLSEDIQDLLRKRTRWMLGWEERAYTPKKKQREGEV
jgi:ribosome modulation factor